MVDSPREALASLTVDINATITAMGAHSVLGLDNLIIWAIDELYSLLYSKNCFVNFLQA